MKIRKSFRPLLPALLAAALAPAFAIPSRISASPDSEAEYMALADSADRFIQAEKWSEAENILRQALRLSPGNFHNALLLSNLGSAQMALGRPSEALESFEIGLAISPKSTTLLTNRAQAWLALDSLENAYADLSQAICLDSTLTRPRRLRGYLLLGAAEPDSAESDFRAILRHSVQREDSTFAICGLAECARAKTDGKEAERLYDLASELSHDPDIYFAKAYMLIASGDIAGAARTVHTGLEYNPDSADMLLLRAWIRKERYELQDSEADLRKAIENGADPQLVELFFPPKSKK